MDQQPIETQRDHHRAYTYNLSPEAHAAMLDAQAGACIDCGKPETVTRNGQPLPLSVDHDHRCCPGPRSCGKCVRGLVCQQCNGRRVWLDKAREDQRDREQGVSRYYKRALPDLIYEPIIRPGAALWALSSLQARWADPYDVGTRVR